MLIMLIQTIYDWFRLKVIVKKVFKKEIKPHELFLFWEVEESNGFQSTVDEGYYTIKIETTYYENWTNNMLEQFWNAYEKTDDT